MIQEVIIKLIAKALSGASATWTTAAAAMASVWEALLRACKSSLAIDVGRLKDALINRVEAQTMSQQAEARRNLAKATSEANIITRREHAVKMEQLEEERKNLENLKLAVQVAAQTVKVNAAKAKLRDYEEKIEERRKKELNSKLKEFFDALERLNLEGGQLGIDAAELEKLLESLDICKKQASKDSTEADPNK